MERDDDGGNAHTTGRTDGKLSAERRWEEEGGFSQGGREREGEKRFEGRRNKGGLEGGKRERVGKEGASKGRE